MSHGMDGVLALAVPLAEDGCSQVTCRGKGGGVRNITHVDHLVGSVQCLETPLVFLSKELGLRGIKCDSGHCISSDVTCLQENLLPPFNIYLRQS